MMNFKSISLVSCLAVGLLASCTTATQSNNLCDDNLDFSAKQLKLQYELAQKARRLPRTTAADGAMHWAHRGFDWTNGFFPGSLWYLYEHNQDPYYKNAAKDMQNLFVSERFNKRSHDLGFVFNCSFGNALRITGDTAARRVLIDASNSLMTRFRPAVGCIQSWDVTGGWQSKRGWSCPVIIDNMMNLEMLFEATKLTGDNKYRDVAIAHAKTTMKHHFRPDYSTYHVIDYDVQTGEVRKKQTAQGYSDDSAWARGQAWGLYGYVICYRYTKDPVFLEQAKHIAHFIMTNDKVPADYIPYWDYDAPADIHNHPRDVSAASCTASALIELSQYAEGDYLAYATDILKNLSTDAYQAKLGENNDFVLMHSVGSIPHNNEIDVPLNYADYYYIEALMRLRKLNM